MLLLGVAVVAALIAVGAPGWSVGITAGAWIALWLGWTRLKIWAVRKTETR